MRWIRTLLSLVTVCWLGCAHGADPPPERARRLAVENALTDDHDRDSPRAVAARARGTGCEQPRSVDRVGCLLDHPLARVREVAAAPRGETNEGSWIFEVQLPPLSNYVFFVVVPRDRDRATYNYGVRLSGDPRTRPYRNRTARGSPRCCTGW
jgi:hypothetical protein